MEQRILLLTLSAALALPAACGPQVIATRTAAEPPPVTRDEPPVPAATARHGDFEFTATVLSDEILGQRAMTVTPVDTDARFAIVMRIESVSSAGQGHLAVGEERTFAVHSPAMTFRGNVPIGQKVRFRIHWEIDDDSKRFSRLHRL